MNAIAIENLSFAYDNKKAVIEIDEFRVRAGERIFLHGPSGSGKTTLLGLLTGILQASSGSVRVLDTDLSLLSARQRDRFRSHRMGYIFQQFNLIPYLSVKDNILLPVWISSERRQRIQSASVEVEATTLADRLGLRSFFRTNVMQLSVGQQQRVAVARALIGQPDFIIADEPTSALDDDRQQEFIDLLLERTQNAKTTVLFVSHNKRLASHFDRSVSLSDLNKRKTETV